MSPSFGSPDRPQNNSEVSGVDAALRGGFHQSVAHHSESESECSTSFGAKSQLNTTNANTTNDFLLFLDDKAKEEVHSVTVRRFHYPRFRLDWVDVKDSTGSTPNDLRLTLVNDRDPKVSRVIDLSKILAGEEERERIEKKLVNIVSTPSSDSQELQHKVDFVLRELVPSLLITGDPLIPAYQNRVSKHRAPISIEKRFAPDVSEFFRGINRTAFLVTRGEELLAEFVSVDDGQSQLSAYVNVAGYNQPIPFFAAGGRKTSLEGFPVEVFDTVYPLLRSKFAPLGRVLTYLTEELQARRVASFSKENEDRKTRDNDLVILASSSDWMNVTASSQDSLRFQETSVRAQPRVVVPSLPIDQLYMYGSHRSIPTALGGEVQLFPLSDGQNTLVRFVATASRKPAVFLEATIPSGMQHTEERISRLIQFGNEHQITDGLARLIHDKISNLRLFGSVVGDSFSLKARELLSHLNNGLSDDHRLHFGFISDVLPSLAPNPADTAVDVLLGRVPFSSILEDRAPGEYSVCQCLVDSDGLGRVAFYSQLGAVLTFSTFEVPEQPKGLKDSLALLYRTFVENNDGLNPGLLNHPGIRLEYCSEDPVARTETKGHLAELAEEWWHRVPAFGYGSDEFFPVLTRDQVRWLRPDTVQVRLPLPRCSPFQEFKCTVTPKGITSIVIEERPLSRFHDPVVRTVRPRQGGTIAAEHVLSALTAVSVKGMLPSGANRECKRTFPEQQFHHERAEPPPPKEAVTEGLLYTLKEWLLWLRVRLPW